MARKRAVVVGCGGMGRGWMRELAKNPRTELVGVVDIRAEAARSAAAEHGLAAERAFTDVGAAIDACAPDFVADITVPEAHCPTSTAALRRGCPVICEKPLGHSMEAARTMCAVSKERRRLLMVSQNRRYQGNHQALAKALADGAIGDITTINCDFYIGAHFGGFRDQMASPLILDMAIHHFDMCRFFARADAQAVYAREFNPKGSWYQGDVSATAVFELERGIIFTYRGSWCAEGCHTSWNGDWRVIGTQGTLLMERDQHPRGERLKPGGKREFHSELEPVPVPEVTPAGDGIAGSISDFLDALERGTTPATAAEDNIRSLAMVFAAIESSARRARVEVAL
jgi:predicted dehydrogenase